MAPKPDCITSMRVMQYLLYPVSCILFCILERHGLAGARRMQSRYWQWKPMKTQRTAYGQKDEQQKEEELGLQQEAQAESEEEATLVEVASHLTGACSRSETTCGMEERVTGGT
ncbi:uncharacterized protein LOC143839702 [Paroedura picta]|uniref:uncharacterized protein LOC143839702 n=1 Tax=Paroedura picta TaxID=143630 RepID=UPI0040577F39